VTWEENVRMRQVSREERLRHWKHLWILSDFDSSLTTPRGIPHETSDTLLRQRNDLVIHNKTESCWWQQTQYFIIIIIIYY